VKSSNIYYVVLFSAISYIFGSVSSPTIGRVESENTRQKLDFVSRLSGSIRVKGKKALFIGDSHTSAYGWGWQDMLCEATGMKLKNTAVSGKQTNWMASRLKYYADTTYSYCFIYGGGNDIAAGVEPAKVYSNISAMVSYCQELNITPVVITGSDPRVVMSPVSSHWKNYIRNESKLQSLLVDSLQGVYVIDVRDIIEKKDCADFICHMKKSGHRKISDCIIKGMNFQEIR
jgi:hypothetical protein